MQSFLDVYSSNFVARRYIYDLTIWILFTPMYFATFTEKSFSQISDLSVITLSFSEGLMVSLLVQPLFVRSGRTDGIYARSSRKLSQVRNSCFVLFQ